MIGYESKHAGTLVSNLVGLTALWTVPEYVDWGGDVISRYVDTTIGHIEDFGIIRLSVINDTY
jgi:hypothetical protein